MGSALGRELQRESTAEREHQEERAGYSVEYCPWKLPEARKDLPKKTTEPLRTHTTLGSRACP